MKRLAAPLSMLALVAGLAGCGIQPWVKPYERAHLADPIMSVDRDPVATAYRSHVFQARGAARGAEAGQGGGCGCN